ncbi:hypothetical protein [Agrobacterium sp. Azo12]|uniref:hypothetical protein n=1 Tax=Agrobacterium sp. Azo12 TaxID=3031129 RepID=UPI0023D87C1F|nr:hypothetical protein [Agrobacterium sp. Azo12]MDO5896549.1 hypothetical protein [Agrobacterium sp. Azo12]
MEEFYENARYFADKVADWRALQDLQAQLDMASWAGWMFWATLFSVAASALAVLLAAKSLSATRQIGESQTQAYILASEANFGSKGNILITVRNTGLTPATHFAVNATAKIVQPGKVTESISFVNHGFKVWSALGSGMEYKVSVLEGDETIKSFHNNSLSGDLLLVSGQVTYCTVFNHDHLTQFAFFVQKGTTRFRRPTSNLITFHRLRKNKAASSRIVEVRLDENDF